VRKICQGCVKNNRGAQILVGVRWCIKIGHPTHIRSISLIQFVLGFFFAEREKTPIRQFIREL